MDKEVLEDLYKRAVSKGYNKTLEDFTLLINSDEEVLLDNYNYVKEKGYNKPIEDFQTLLTEKKNPEVSSIRPTENIPIAFSDSNFSLDDTKLSSDLFEPEKADEYRTFFNYNGFGIPTIGVEKDTDGQYLKGGFGDFINQLPFGDFIDDQARAWASGKEDADAAEAAAELMNEIGTFKKGNPTVEQANTMLKEMFESQTTPMSDEMKQFQKDLQENGNDAYAAVKAAANNPSAATEYVMRSMRSMFNDDAIATGLATLGTNTALGAAAGGPLGALGGFMRGIPAAMTAMGAQTDMALSFGEFFLEELGDGFTREDVANLLQDPEKLQEVQNRALARGVSIAAVNAFTAGLGIRVASNVFRAGRKGLRAGLESFAKVTPLDMAGGSLGEFAAQGTSGQEFNTAEIALEGLLDPMSSIATTVGGTVIDAGSAPSYKINGGKTTKADFIRRLGAMSDEQLEQANFTVNNDDETWRQVDDRLKDIQFGKEIKEIYGDIDDEQTRRLTDLEKEKRTLEKKKSTTAQKRLADVNKEIDEVLEIYKTKREAIGILSAPYYDRNVSSVEDAQKKRKSKEYKQYKTKAKKLAETMGLTVSGMNDGIGGYFLDDGTYLQELSSEVYLEGATYEQAIEYASVLGAITPETQESTIAGMIVGEGEGDASKFNFIIEDNNNLEGVRTALDELGIEYSMNTDTGEIGIIDFADGNNVELNEKIGIFVQVLNENNINHEQRLERIRSKYIGAEDRAGNLRNIKENSSKFGKNGESVRYIAEQAEKRNKKYLDEKKKAPKTVEEESQEPIVVKPLPENSERLQPVDRVKKIARTIRRAFRRTFLRDAGLPKNIGDAIRAYRRKGTAIQNYLSDQQVVFLDMYDAATKSMTKKQERQFGAYVNEALAGNVVDGIFTPEQQNVIESMRLEIDKKTDELVAMLEKHGKNDERTQELIKTLQDNKGTYIHRTYSAFKDLNYLQEMIGDPALARSSINESYDLLVAETAMDQGISIVEAKKLVDDYIAQAFDAPDRSTYIASLADGKISSPFLKKRNKNLSEAFKNYLGEIKDPLYNYVNTLEKVSSYIAAVEYQQNLSNSLLRMGLATTEGGPGKKRLESGQQSFNILSKLYVPDDVYEAYQDIQRLAPIQNDFLRYIVTAQGSVKYGKTILSPMTTARNFISGALITMLNGENILNPGNWQNASKSMRLAWDTKKSPKEIKAEVQKLIELGVMKDGGRAQEIMEIINDIYALEGLRRKSGTLGKNVDKFNNLVTKVYQFGDDYYKTFAFYQKRDAFVETGMSVEEATQKAADRVRNGQPTYSQLPRTIRQLRRFPLTGTFVSFPYLITQAHFNNLKFIAEDFKEGRNKMALKHALNYSMAIAIPYGISMGSRAMFDITDDEDNALKDMMPEYYRDASFVYTGKDPESGELQYFDINTIAPSAQIKKGLDILMKDRNGRNLPDKIKLAAWEQLEPYLSLDLTANTGIAIVTGVDPTTGNVLSDDIYERVKWGVNNISPGAIRNAANIARSQGWFGLDEINPYTGRRYTVEDELLALLGFRVQTTSWDLQLKNYARKNSIQSSDAVKQKIKNVKGQQSKSLGEVEGIVTDYREDMLEFSENLLYQIDAARKQGMEEGEIVNALSGGGFNSKNVNALMKGEMLELQGISKTQYDREIEMLKDRPDLAANMAKNLDMYNFFVNEKNYDSRVRKDLYRMMRENASDEDILALIKKSSVDIYKRTLQSPVSKDLKYNQEDVRKAEVKSFMRYKDIYQGYKALHNNPNYQGTALDSKSVVDMLYETDTEMKSLLLFKYLDGNHDNNSINKLNNLHSSITGKNISKGVLEMLQYRILYYSK
tara:strand:+ start:3731 stop:9235 length:5505 start_codon:yes stop_codon:yes gene_type:complete